MPHRILDIQACQFLVQRRMFKVKGGTSEVGGFGD